MSRRRWLIALSAVAAVVVCGIIFTVATDTGTVEIDAPDGVNFQVTVLRNDQPVIEGWQIKTGENEQTIRTGRIKIVLPRDREDEFDVLDSEKLVVRRKKTVFTLTKREAPKSQDAAKPQATVVAKFDPGSRLRSRNLHRSRNG